MRQRLMIHFMEKNYNIYRKNLQLPEYGRHIHQMVDNLMAIEDRDERNRKARVVINVMGNLNPLLRDTPEFTHKLWDHLFIMSDFQLDVDSPYPQPSRQELTASPRRMTYSQGRITYKHYGKYVERMIRGLADERNPRTVSRTVDNLARYMRSKSYEYNQEHPNNEVIVKDIKHMSGGAIEIDEAASRIKEEVDEDANIIFGSSYDETLAGKIRVSIVATGIGEKGAPAKPKAVQKAKEYLEESYNRGEESVAAVAAAVELDSNLEKFSAVKEDDAAEISETIESAEIVSIEEKQNGGVEAVAGQDKVRHIEDFDMLEKSAVMEDMPKSSALFKAIINKAEDANDAADLASALSSSENGFAPKTVIRTVEEEPELFPDHNPAIFAPKRQEEPEELIVEDEDEDYTPTLIERVTGFSIARRNKKKQKEKEAGRVQEPISPSFSEDYSEDRMNLDIPSFLRRK